MNEIECRECDGTGEGFGRPCGGCRGRGTRVVPAQHDGSLCAMEGALEAEASIADADLPEMPWERSYEVTGCRECGEKHPAKALRGATAAQAERSHKIIEGDLLCADCRAELTPIRWQASGLSASLAAAMGFGGAL